MVRWSLVSLVVVGCSGGDEACPDLGGEPVFTAFDVAPTTAAAGDTVDITVAGDHLGDLAASSDGSMEEEGEEEESACLGGHLHIYLDDLETNPITMQEALAFPVTLPTELEAGVHTLIVRLHNHDHTIYEPEVTRETELTVE